MYQLLTQPYFPFSILLQSSFVPTTWANPKARFFRDAKCRSSLTVAVASETKGFLVLEKPTISHFKGGCRHYPHVKSKACLWPDSVPNGPFNRCPCSAYLFEHSGTYFSQHMSSGQNPHSLIIFRSVALPDLCITSQVSWKKQAGGFPD